MKTNKLLLTVIAVLALIISLESAFAQNYIYTTEWDTGNQFENITANRTLTVTVPTNASYESAYIDITPYASVQWTYQETATSYAANETDGFPYWPERANDSLWYPNDGATGFSGVPLEMWFNYTVPSNTVAVYWQVQGSNPIEPRGENVTVPDRCYTSGGTMRLRAISWHNSGVRGYCHNGTDYEEIYSRFANSVGNFYEEAVYFGTLEYPSNITVLMNETEAYSITSQLNESVTITLNISVINAYTDSNGTIPIKITALDWGTSGTLTMNTTFQYQDLWICNGSDWQQTSYNFSIYDEDNFSKLTGDISIDLTYGISVLSYEAEDVHSLALCIGGSQNYTISGTVYSDVAYRHKHFLSGAVFTSTQNDVRLYNYPDGMSGLTDLEWTSRDQSYSFYKNLIVKMQRYYPANHTWIVVQQDNSGEFGNSIFQIYQSDVDYRFYFYDSSGTFLDSTTSVKFVCDVGEACKVESQVIPVATPDRNINAVWVFNNNTKILTVDWNDPTGATSAVYISLVRMAVPQDIMICNTTVYSASGGYTCNATGYIGNAMLTIRSSGSPWEVFSKDIINLYGVPTLADFIPLGESALWTFGFVLTISLMGLASPVGVVIMALVALWIMSLLGLSSVISIGFLGIAVVMGLTIAVIISKVKK